MLVIGLVLELCLTVPSKVDPGPCLFNSDVFQRIASSLRDLFDPVCLIV